MYEYRYEEVELLDGVHEGEYAVEENEGEVLVETSASSWHRPSTALIETAGICTRYHALHGVQRRKSQLQHAQRGRGMARMLGYMSPSDVDELQTSDWSASHTMHRCTQRVADATSHTQPCGVAGWRYLSRGGATAIVGCLASCVCLCALQGRSGIMP